jgi:hypothetical protein
MSPATGSAAALFQLAAQLVNAQSVTGVITPAGVDITDFDGILHVTQNCGAQVGGTLAGKIQSSPDNSVWTDVTGAAFSTVTTGNSVQILALDTALCQRFIRYTNTFAGTSILVAVTATGILKVR